MSALRGADYGYPEWDEAKAQVEGVAALRARREAAERERDELRVALALWRRLAEARAALNTAYRLGSSMRADKALSEIEAIEAQIAAHDEVKGQS